MHKFIIVGHPQSGYQDVEKLLNECGMGAARPSRREKLLPAEISEMLRKAHGTPALVSLGSTQEVEQIGTAPVWHGMAMDLMLGNLDQRFWGWSDPGAIHLLEYWKQLDPSINFVFVYADPQSALLGIEPDEHIEGESSVEAKLLNWHAFNRAMLHFHHRNPQRGVLVHSEQVRRSVRAYLQQLRTQLNAPLEDPPAHLLLEEEQGLLAARTAPAAVEDAEADREALVVSRQSVSVPARELVIADESDLTRYLATQCVAEHPIVVELYEELQAVANLPLENAVQPGASVGRAWAGLQQQRSRLEQQRTELRTQQEAARALQEQVDAHRSASEAAAQRTDTLSLELERLQRELTEHGNTKEENELLLAQLHQVQEELEQQLSSRKAQEAALVESSAKLEAAIAAEAKSKELLAAQTLSAQAAEKRSADLSKELASLQEVLAKHASTEEENELLLTQLHQVQEELERLFLNSKTQDSALSEAMKKLEAARAEEQRLTKLLAVQSESNHGSEKRIKTLSAELEAVHAKERKLKNEFAATQSAQQAADKRIAALSTELDALRKAAADQDELKQENELLLTQLHQVQEELERYFLETQRLKQTMVPRAAPLYGAADRVKQQLTYRLGATMIERSRSLGGWISMPFALIGTTRRFRADVRARGDEKLPPISKYQDRHEAERVKQHLSYRIGAALLRNVKSPVGWMRLPFALRREVKAFRAERKSRKLNG